MRKKTRKKATENSSLPCGFSWHHQLVELSSIFYNIQVHVAYPQHMCCIYVIIHGLYVTDQRQSASYRWTKALQDLVAAFFFSSSLSVISLLPLFVSVFEKEWCDNFICAVHLLFLLKVVTLKFDIFVSPKWPGFLSRHHPLFLHFVLLRIQPFFLFLLFFFLLPHIN